MGGQNMCDSHPVSKRVVELRYDGLLEKGKQDFMHFLGTSKLEWALVLTDIQRAIRKHPMKTLQLHLIVQVLVYCKWSNVHRA